MGQVVVSGREVEAEQETARKMLRELVRKRQELEKRGTELRNRAAAMLRGTFGFTSEELIPFGIRPRPRNTAPRKSRKKAPTIPSRSASRAAATSKEAPPPALCPVPV